MSTVKSIYLQHLNGTTPNATMDTNGNFTVGGTVSGASSNMFRNRIINGDMRIDQRNAGASVTASTGNPYTVDRWTAISSQNSKFTIQQNAGSVTPPAGFVNYLGITSSSAYTVGSSEQFLIRQNIEGFNTADLAWGTSNAKTVTLSFWVRSSLTGTFGGALYNNDGSRSYPFTYTISAANTWEYKTITISGDTAGTWQTTTSVGVTVDFGLGVGSTLSGTAGTWASAYYGSATGTTSVVGTSGATWYVTGVQFEVGTAATPFEFRSFGTELALCQRYFYMHARGHASSDVILFYGMGWATSQLEGTIRLPVTMRTIPVVVASSVSAEFQIQTNSFTTTFTGSSLNNWGLSTDTPMIYVTGLSGITNGVMYRVSIVGGKSSSYLGFNAEL